MLCLCVCKYWMHHTHIDVWDIPYCKLSLYTQPYAVCVFLHHVFCLLLRKVLIHILIHDRDLLHSTLHHGLMWFPLWCCHIAVHNCYASLDASVTPRIWHILRHWKETPCVPVAARESRQHDLIQIQLSIGLGWCKHSCAEHWKQVSDADACWKICSATECHGVLLWLWHPSAAWHHREAPEITLYSTVHRKVACLVTIRHSKLQQTSSYEFLVFFVLHANLHRIVSHAPGHLDEAYRDNGKRQAMKRKSKHVNIICNNLRIKMERNVCSKLSAICGKGVAPCQHPSTEWPDTTWHNLRSVSSAPSSSLPRPFEEHVGNLLYGLQQYRAAKNSHSSVCGIGICNSFALMWQDWRSIKSSWFFRIKVSMNRKIFAIQVDITLTQPPFACTSFWWLFNGQIQ